MRTTTVVLVLAAVVVAAAACSDDSSAPTAAASQASSAQPAPTPTSTPLDFDLPEGDEETYPEWDPASREQATAAGDAVMRAFVRPDAGSGGGTDGTAETSVIEAGWWEALAPLLTPDAQDAYFYVDPAEVPATAVTGPAALVESGADGGPGTTAFLATVQVPTDVGTYDVLLARTGGGAPWLAERISPPEALSAPPTEPPREPPAEDAPA